MKKNNLSHKRLLFLIPIFVLPLTAIVYVLFQFKTAPPKDVSQRDSQFNSSLPAPQLEKKDKNKLELYMEAKEDSIQREKALKNKGIFDTEEYEEFVVDTSAAPPKNKLRDQERKINDQLETIMGEIHHQNGALNEKSSGVVSITNTSKDVERLEKLLQTMKNPAVSGEDTEMERLDDMLDKIIQIQQPANEEKENNKDSLPLALPTSALRHDIQIQGFWPLEEDILQPTVQKAAIRAIIPEDQSIKEGGTIKLRLLSDIYLDQVKIPDGHLVYGVCAIGNERMNVAINSIVYNGTIFPVKLRVYDIDGFSGIHVPGAITRDAARQGLTQSIQSVSPTLSAQIATAGLQSLKNMMSSKVRVVQATVKSGHEVLLQ